MSLRLRLLVILAPLFVLGLVAADAATYVLLQSSLVQRVDEQLVGAHHDVAVALVGGQPGGPGPGPDGGGARAFVPPGTYGEILSSSGQVIAAARFGFGGTAGSAHPVLPTDITAQAAHGGTYLTVSGVGGVDRYRCYADSNELTSNATLVVGIPLDDVDATMRRLLLLELSISGGVTFVVVVATWLLVRRGLRPLERMGATARSIAASDLSRRVTPSNDRSEVGRLGVALNTMLTQLEATFNERAAQEQRLRHFISDASHELRTPLTSMQGYAELMRRAPDMDREDILLAMRRMEDETRRMGMLVDELLLLARLDQGRPLERVNVDLEALVRDACADARAADPTRQVSARVSAPLVVLGDDVRLRQVLGNVVRNALVHTPGGTPIEVSLRAEGEDAVIDVVDHGPGIPPGHSDRIFERFHRADPHRSRDQGGSGLGLSIASAVVAAHGGSIAVSGTPGGGATFTIRLPLTADTVRPADEPTAAPPSEL